MTPDPLIDQFTQELTRMRRSPRTIRNRRQILGQWSRFLHDRDITLLDASRDDVLDFLAQYREPEAERELDEVRWRARHELRAAYRTYLWEATYAHECREAGDLSASWRARCDAGAARAHCRSIAWINQRLT